MAASMSVMSATRVGGFARSRIRVAVAFVGIFTLASPSACRPSTEANVPTLVTQPVTSAATTTAPVAAPDRHVEAIVCVDAKKIVEAHACPPGPDEDYASLASAEAARFAATPTKRGKRAAPRRTDLAPRPFTESETAYRERVERFVCRAADGIERNEARYALARLHFEAHHWDEAATLFHENAQIPDDATAPYAASLSLESLNVLGSRGKAECYDLLSDRTRGYVEAFCVPRRRATNEELCNTLGHILTDLQRLEAEQTVP